MENLQIVGLYEKARRAHSNTSFSPEKRAQTDVETFEALLAEDLKRIPLIEQEQYKINFTKYLFEYLHSRSQIASPMITGPANFPVQRMQKLNRWADNKYSAFYEFRERALKAITKKVEAAKTPEQKEDERWEKIEANLRSTAGTIRDIDAGRVHYSRTLFVNGLTGFIKRLAENGEKEIVNRALCLLRELNEQPGRKPIVTAKHAVWNMGEVATSAKAKQEDVQARESREYPFTGGVLIINYGANRVQIKHDQKPEPAIIGQMKSAAFKWAPSVTLWQRQLTRDALIAGCKITGLNYMEIDL